jgi:hypothetical protein
VLSLVVILQASAASLLILTLQVPILARSLLRFDFYFNLINTITASTCWAISCRGSVWNRVFVCLMVTGLFGGFMGVVHAIQIRRWLKLVVELNFTCAFHTSNLFCAAHTLTSVSCTSALSGFPALGAVSAFISLEGGFKDIYTNLGFMPYEVNIRAILINNALLVSVFQAKLAIRELCSPNPKRCTARHPQRGSSEVGGGGFRSGSPHAVEQGHPLHEP